MPSQDVPPLGSSMFVTLLPMSLKPCEWPLLSMYWPTMAPELLIPSTHVSRAPGTSMVVKLNLSVGASAPAVRQNTTRIAAVKRIAQDRCFIIVFIRNLLSGFNNGTIVRLFAIVLAERVLPGFARRTAGGGCLRGFTGARSGCLAWLVVWRSGTGRLVRLRRSFLRVGARRRPGARRWLGHRPVCGRRS